MRNQFFIVRHGQSENNVLELYHSNVQELNRYGLTDFGREQIMSTAQRTPKLHKIYTSPFRRTLETAEIFQLSSQADLHIDHRLREIDLGELQHEPHIDLPVYREEEPIFGGESIAEIRDRMIEFVTEINAAHQDLNILIVTHGGPMEILQHYLYQDTPFQFAGLNKIPKNGELVHLNA